MTPEEDTIKPVILIAEDSPTQARQLEYILRQHGYQVEIAANGRLALEMAKQRKPTLIISDVVMPEMDGYELCRRVKADETLEDIPLILVTTLSDPQDVIRGLECRADNFILKPYEDSFLLNRIRFVLLNREMRQLEKIGMGVEILFNGHRHFITADRIQILNLLLSTYEAAIQRNKELNIAQESLRDVNASLQAANRDMEAFSYSVSHDLRAPLRAIEGFSKLLEAKSSGAMSPEAGKLLEGIVTNVKHMGELINGLLRLSRFGRQAIARQLVDVAGVVRCAVDDLRKEHASRQIEVTIANLPPCNADQQLLTQVFINLLSNAFKYTWGRDKAVINVDYYEQTGEIVYLIRDNGAGFDMEYSEKLFRVFQRLHSTEEFEGTGIGLSIVQRIIERHGGRVWAEGAVDQGATFYFSLPKEIEPSSIESRS